MYDDKNGRTIVCFLPISCLKKPLGKKKYFKYFSLRYVFKKGEFCQFLASKFFDKIWHCFNMFCNFFVSENFGTTPVNGDVEQ